MEKSEKNSEQEKINKQAEILQATFEHYYNMARDHYAVMGTTANLFLVLVAAILLLVGLDDQICASHVDIGSAIAIMLIGIFGAMWARKQQERYHYWEFYAIKYREELEAIMPGLKTREEYKSEAKKESECKFGRFFGKRLRDSHLWIYLSLVVCIVGIGLYLHAKDIPCSKTPAATCVCSEIPAATCVNSNK